MNIRVIQPPYPARPEDTGRTVAFIMQELDRCDESLDLILLPECCNAPSGCGDSELLKVLVECNTEPLIRAVKETAIRCNATVGINLYCKTEHQKVQNTTLLFDGRGKLAGKYIKQHLPVSEYSNPFVDHSYLCDNNPPQCAEVDGIRYAFLTCYDIYYTEFIHRMQLEKPDVILISSLQRAEREDILEMQAKYCAFICNSYVVRSSFSMGSSAQTGGCSMIVAPDGNVLTNFHQFAGSFDYVIEDPTRKYMRSNGFGQPDVANDVYQSFYRSPWCYRASGSGVRPNNKETGFPRLCAHRGFITGAPENTLPSIAVAISMGAVEVEIDVRPTADGVLVISHDPHVERLTDGIGIIGEMTCEELMRLDPGKKFSPAYQGVRYATLEEVFRTFPRRTIFNLHVKPLDNVTDYRPMIRQIVELAKRYDCTEHFYFASESVAVLEAALEVAPEIDRCALMPETLDVFPAEVLEWAIQYQCTRFQSLSGYITEDVIARAHERGIRYNLFYADDPETAKDWLEKGVDVILTDNYLVVSQGIGLH